MDRSYDEMEATSISSIFIAVFAIDVKKQVVTPGRFELPARSLGNCCSIHLSYGATFNFSRSSFRKLLIDITFGPSGQGHPIYEATCYLSLLQHWRKTAERNYAQTLVPGSRVESRLAAIFARLEQLLKIDWL